MFTIGDRTNKKLLQNEVSIFSWCIFFILFLSLFWFSQSRSDTSFCKSFCGTFFVVLSPLILIVFFVFFFILVEKHRMGKLDIRKHRFWRVLKTIHKVGKNSFLLDIWHLKRANNFWHVYENSCKGKKNPSFVVLCFTCPPSCGPKLQMSHKGGKWLHATVSVTPKSKIATSNSYNISHILLSRDGNVLSLASITRAWLDKFRPSLSLTRQLY